MVESRVKRSRVARAGTAMMALAALAVPGCGSAESPAPGGTSPGGGTYPVTVPGCNGEKITVEHEPARVVTANASNLELLFWLGAADKVIGTGSPPRDGDFPDEFAEAARQVRPMGGGQMMMLSREELIGSGADLYIQQFGPRAGMADVATPEQFRQVGMSRVFMTSTACPPDTPRLGLKGVEDDIVAVGRVVNRAARATELVEGMETRLRRVADALGPLTDDRRPGVFIFDASFGDPGSPTAVCSRSMANAVVHLAGGRNAFADCGGNTEKTSWEQVVQRDPDWIAVMVSNQGSDDANESAFDRAQERLETTEATRDLRAVRDHRIVRVTLEHMTIGGVRSPDTVAEVAAALHPDAVDFATPRADRPGSAPAGPTGNGDRTPGMGMHDHPGRAGG